MTAKKSSLSRIAKRMVEEYEISTRGGAGFLTDKMRRAFLADAMYSLMLAQYDVEKQTGQDKFVEAYGEARDFLGI